MSQIACVDQVMSTKWLIPPMRQNHTYSQECSKLILINICLLYIEKSFKNLKRSFRQEDVVELGKLQQCVTKYRKLLFENDRR